ncbi:MAG: DUF302 domain-containing protein [Methylococcaceae bacterium]|nr:MAG: DUF302 domain-containing protein [Methylococcaceae bacterium]
MRLRDMLFPCAVWGLACYAQAIPAAGNVTPDGYYQAESSKPFQEVVDDLKLIISEKNFRLTGHQQIGKAIRERDGAPFPDYDVLQFCNLGYAKEYLQIDPDGVRHMPCSLAVYSKNGKVLIVTHLLSTATGNARLDQFGVKINGLLQEMIDYAARR